MARRIDPTTANGHRGASDSRAQCNPFRTDEDEAKRLARRFDQKWFPSDQENLHARLRTGGILAHAEVEPYGSGFDLSSEHAERLDRLVEKSPDDPFDWEESSEFQRLLNEINEQLGMNPHRSARIAGLIEGRREHKRILLFANSVHHAEQMALLLNQRNIWAAPISGKTPTATRRHFLEQFDKGELRVLCNHTVLSTGFDAPKTDMILIARQVFSPVRYMQMVGRGLRGPKNGGTESCKILTVEDNFGRFGERLAYHYCRKYFQGA